MQGPPAYLADCVSTVKQTFDLALLKNKENKMSDQNPFAEIPLGYFNALMNTVVGDDKQQKLAKEYLAKVEPETWS